MGGDPIDGLLETGGEIDLGLPAEVGAGFGVIGEEAHDLRLVRAEALGVNFDADGLADECDDVISQLSDADLHAGAEVESFAVYTFGFGGFDETVDCVGEVGKVALRIKVAEANDILGEGLGDDGGDDGASGLTGTVGVKGADGDSLDAIGAVEAFDELVGADLAGGVGRLPLEGMVFGDGDAQGGAVDFAGGGVDEAAVELAASLEDVEGADDVGFDDFVGMKVGIGDRDEGAEMEDEVGAADGLLDGIGVAQVAGDDLDLGEEPTVIQ